MGYRQAVIQAAFGNIDTQPQHVVQDVPYDYYWFSEHNLPPRLPPRLQAKIPKMFAWQLLPGYNYYLWLDGNIALNSPNTVKHFQEQIDGHDIVVIRHHRRPNIRQEVRYLRKGLREQSNYLVARYNNEYWKEQYELIEKDEDFVDDLLVIGGIFMYRNTPQVQAMLKEWWYHNTRYNIQDQISFPYVLKKSGIKIKILDHDYTKWNLISHQKHKNRNQ